MAEFGWTYDYPSGVGKNHALSERVLSAAIAQTVVPQFAGDAGGFGRKQGESVTWTRIGNLAEPTSAVLTENNDIPEDDVTITERSATVQPLGRKIRFSSLAEDLAFFDLGNQFQARLRDQMSLVLDTLAAVAAKDSLIKYAATGATSKNIAVNGTFATAALVNLGVWHLDEIFDYLYDTLHTPYYEDNSYIGIFRWLALKGLGQDPDFEEWHKYTDPTTRYTNERGRWAQIRLMATNHSNAFGKVGTGSVAGEGVVFGRDHFRLAEAMSPELRVGIPTELGLRNMVGWYGILRYRSTWGDSANAGEATGLHFGSA